MLEQFRIKVNRTIESILDLETGKEIFATDFFKKSINEIFQYRYEFESAIRKNAPRYVCYYCRQSIKIRGRADSKRIFHFAHKKDSDDCLIKTNSSLTKEEILRIKYNGAKESNLHFDLKSFISNFLSKNKEHHQGVESVEVEKRNKHQAIPNSWKRPDITCSFNTKNIVFEIQLSTTFLSVINSRQEFYKENDTYILWVFNSFETEDEKRKFTQSDVLYSNNQNVFELDSFAKKQSILENDLVLKCNYLKPSINKGSLLYKWEYEYVKLSNLTFNDSTFQVYYSDVQSISEYLKLYLEIGQSEIFKLIYFGEVSEIFEYFKKWNYVTMMERKNIISLFKSKVSSKKIVHHTSLEFSIIIVTLLLKLNNSDLIEEFVLDLPLRETVTDILSLKLDKIIGYSYQNQIQISQRLLETRPEYMDLYIRAVKQYMPSLLSKVDLENKLSEKITQRKLSDISQKKINKIIEKIFPELVK